jgi:hypothetical protein
MPPLVPMAGAVAGGGGSSTPRAGSRCSSPRAASDGSPSYYASAPSDSISGVAVTGRPIGGGASRGAVGRPVGGGASRGVGGCQVAASAHLQSPSHE